MIIYQYKNGYRYNSDSIILYDFISKDKLKGIGLDIGAGSGILSLLLSENKNIKIDAIDIQEENVKLCKENYEKNNLDYKVILGDIKDYKVYNYYDFIISNPPFYSKMQAQNKHLNISRHIDFLPLEILLKSADKLLKPKGFLYFCYDAKKIDLIFETLKNTNLKCEIIRFIHTKAEKPSNLVLIKARKLSKSDVLILPPLICNDSNGTTKEFNSIYQNIKVQSYDLQ
ncbi:methyltransferase [Campylobacter sp. 2018MI13]|uniref:tRNA1(Val) (adenine(37)-N6)-methyltransferase n=1 Tax=Campylobacter sp. 2018MI13 TaxID=2836737 RepID=UPI001BDACA0D|nr:methyltransferase [Campylobacter sp. 2018MI13]MBT0881944.1 methyltransferase [Campylobacter sp. 2018MI13]